MMGCLGAASNPIVEAAVEDAVRWTPTGIGEAGPGAAPGDGQATWDELNVWSIMLPPPVAVTKPPLRICLARMKRRKAGDGTCSQTRVLVFLDLDAHRKRTLWQSGEHQLPLELAPSLG